MAERMIMVWLLKAWEGVLKLLELALKHWRITLAVIACIAIYAHAVIANRRVSALEDQITAYQATIAQYKRTEAVLRQAVGKETAVAKKKVAETDPASADWSAVPVPDAVADQLRNY
jgi:hypothetical protein